MVEIPEHLLERSRQARARLSGEAVEGGEAAPTTAAPPPAAEVDAPASAAPVAAEPVAPEGVAPEPVAVEPEAPEPQLPAVPEPVAASSGVAMPGATPPPAGAPLEIGVRGLAARSGQAMEPAGVGGPPLVLGDEPVGATGISQFTRTSGPRWLLAFSGVIGLLMFFYVVQYQAGPRCGHGGAVNVDSKTGNLVNCEGDPLGAATVPNIKTGGLIFQANCATCHGAQGQGGVGRPLNAGGTLLADFPTLAAQVEFVQKGSVGLPVYGALQRKAAGSMPAWAGTLTDFDLFSAVMYEREVLHGGIDPAAPTEALPPPFGTAGAATTATVTASVTGSLTTTATTAASGASG